MKFKKGMMVEIKTDLTKTQRAYGIDDIMKRMRGKVFDIKKVIDNDSVRIKSPDGNMLYVFSGCDLKIRQLVTTPKPTISKSVSFDPKELDI